MSAQYKASPDSLIVTQIDSLKKRVILIRNMQAFGMASLFSCVLCMFCLFAELLLLGKIIFAISLLLMLCSLGLSLKEILMSVQALNMELKSVEDPRKP